jgi:hypothetical protein
MKIQLSAVIFPRTRSIGVRRSGWEKEGEVPQACEVFLRMWNSRSSTTKGVHSSPESTERLEDG